MFDTIISMAGNALSGGLLGLVGTGIHAFLAYKSTQVKNNHELAMRKLDIDEISQEAALRLKQTETEIAGQQAITEAKTDADIRAASYAADKATYGITWVDALRGIMRPLITIYSLGLMTWIGLSLHSAAGGVIPNAAQLWAQIVGTIILLTTTCVTWWFGSRRIRTGGGNG